MELRSTRRRFRWYWSKSNQADSPDFQEYGEEVSDALERAYNNASGTQKKIRIDDERYVDLSSRDHPVQRRYDDKKKANERLVRRVEEVDEVLARWFWSGDASGKTDKWVEYAEDLAVKLEKALKAKQASVAVDDERFVDLSDADNFFQRRKDDPGKRRAVKREVTIKRKKDEKKAVWSWFGDGRWEPYGDAVTAELEVAYQAGGSRIDVDDVRFVDLSNKKNMYQARADGTGKPRAVQRELVSADDDEGTDGQPLAKKAKPATPPASTPVPKPSSGALRGLVFAQTGSHSMVRVKLEAFIQEHGGRTTDGVTGGTTHLIANATDSQTSKFLKAQQRGIPIVEEAFLHECIKRNAVVDVSPFLIT